ncbi:hypothetical protein EDB19DRAFT_895081 [Suillus lakei]|nr:hypothetical protein EDB19DRAFT_895081 [Suillus lakei]
MLVVHPGSFCDVCLDPYSISPGPTRSPHAIACGHIFCLTCLRSLSLSACPLCREPFQLDRVKKLYLANPPKRDNTEQDTIDDHHASLLQRISPLSGEDTPDAEVVKVVTEVQEWLQSQSGNPDYHIPLRAIVACLQRFKALQDQSKREKAESRRLHDQLRTCKLYADLDSRLSRIVEENLLSRIQKIENQHALEVIILFSGIYAGLTSRPCSCRDCILSWKSLEIPNLDTLTLEISSLSQINYLAQWILIPTYEGDTLVNLRPLHRHALFSQLTPRISVVFSLIVFFGIIEFAISAWLTSQFNAYHNYFSLAGRDCTRFLLFTSMWTIVFSIHHVFFFFPLSDNVLSSTASHIFFLFLTWAFWTAGAASITAALGEQLNRNTQSFFTYCGQLVALEVFAWVILVLVTFAIFVVYIRGVLARSRGDGVHEP